MFTLAVLTDKTKLVKDGVVFSIIQWKEIVSNGNTAINGDFSILNLNVYIQENLVQV